MWPHTRIIFLQHKTHWILFFFRVYPIGGQWVNWLDVLTSLFSAASAVGPHPYHPDGPVLSVLSADARHLSLGLLRFWNICKETAYQLKWLLPTKLFLVFQEKSHTQWYQATHGLSVFRTWILFLEEKEKRTVTDLSVGSATNRSIRMDVFPRTGGGGALLSWRGAYWLSDGKWLKQIKSNGPIFFKFNLLL